MIGVEEREKERERIQVSLSPVTRHIMKSAAGGGACGSQRGCKHDPRMCVTRSSSLVHMMKEFFQRVHD